MEDLLILDFEEELKVGETSGPQSYPKESYPQDFCLPDWDELLG